MDIVASCLSQEVQKDEEPAVVQTPEPKPQPDVILVSLSSEADVEPLVPPPRPVEDPVPMADAAPAARDVVHEAPAETARTVPAGWEPVQLIVTDESTPLSFWRDNVGPWTDAAHAADQPESMEVETTGAAPAAEEDTAMDVEPPIVENQMEGPQLPKSSQFTKDTQDQARSGSSGDLPDARITEPSSQEALAAGQAAEKTWWCKIAVEQPHDGAGPMADLSGRDLGT